MPHSILSSRPVPHVGLKQILFQSGILLIPGHVSSVGVPSTWNTRPSWSSTDLPEKIGPFSVRSSARMQPADQMSWVKDPVRIMLPPNRISGERYCRVHSPCDVSIFCWLVASDFLWIYCVCGDVQI